MNDPLTDIHSSAVYESKRLLRYLHKLGTYEQAMTDDRYKLHSITPPEPENPAGQIDGLRSQSTVALNGVWIETCKVTLPRLGSVSLSLTLT